MNFALYIVILLYSASCFSLSILRKKRDLALYVTPDEFVGEFDIGWAYCVGKKCMRFCDSESKGPTNPPRSYSWCYTSATNEIHDLFTDCKVDSECDSGWECSGPCQGPISLVNFPPLSGL